MVDNRVVRKKAANAADDARSQLDFSDAEAEVLEDLLRGDEAFGALQTAQWNAVLVDADEHDVDAQTLALAGRGANSLGKALDRILEQRRETAREIVALRDAIDDDAVPWGVALEIYRGGYESIGGLREAHLHEFIADTGMSPPLAEAVMDAVSDEEDGA